MAKKITRGITGIKDINNQDYDTNNVNDLLSDGQYNYIHRKKGKAEEYHNLTDNIKTISSDNTDLLTVTNNNKTNNTATLHPKHDAQKEQVLESERNTITINHGTNATTEKTKVDTNPQKVLEHENLHTAYGISKATSGNTTTLGLEYTKVTGGFDLNNLENGRVKAENFVNAPKTDTWFYVSSFKEGNYIIQDAVSLIDAKNTTYRRTKQTGTWGAWREQLGDKSTVDALLSQKQNKLTAMDGLIITADNISLNVNRNYTGDLNNLTYTCIVKPTDEATNLPTGVNGHGILKVVRISDVVSQQYHMYSNNSIYIRSCRGANNTPQWSTWVKISTTPLT